MGSLSTHLNYISTNSLSPSWIILLLLKFYKWKGMVERRKQQFLMSKAFATPTATSRSSNSYPKFCFKGLITANRQNSHLIEGFFFPPRGNPQRQGKNNYSHPHPEFWMRQRTQGVPDTFVSLRCVNNHIKDIWQDKCISTVFLLMGNTRYSSWLEFPKYPSSLLFFTTSLA